MLSYNITGTYTDLYELAMGQAYLLQGRKHEPSAFDYFFRKLPNQSGYVVFAGLDDVLTILETLRFGEEDIRYLQSLNFHPAFIEYLKGFEFKCSVYSVSEGEIVFANTPLLRVEGNIIEAQLVETLLLNFLNFESLIATKASRMRLVAGSRVLSDFGLRRAQGTGGILAAKAALIGGFNSTSNVYAARLYGIPAVGTMAHSYIESHDSELEAFRAFAVARADDCIFLVDTYNTLSSGVPNAIRVAQEMEKAGKRAKGIRLDSGDLGYLSKAARKMLDEAGLPYMKIVASNQLDEYVIKSLIEQDAPIDIFGVGTKLVTGKPDAALDGVYKLAMAAGKPRLKLSETAEKITLPGIKRVLRVLDEEGCFWGADAIVLAEEGEKANRIFHPFQPSKQLEIQHFPQSPLLKKVMHKGKKVFPASSITKIAQFSTQRLALLSPEYKRFENPHVYKVGISEKLKNLREQLSNQHSKA